VPPRDPVFYLQLLYHVVSVNFHVSLQDPPVCYTLYILHITSCLTAASSFHPYFCWLWMHLGILLCLRRYGSFLSGNGWVQNVFPAFESTWRVYKLAVCKNMKGSCCQDQFNVGPRIFSRRNVIGLYETWYQILNLIYQSEAVSLQRVWLIRPHVLNL
jgi:hypothetical protein